MIVVSVMLWFCGCVLESKFLVLDARWEEDADAIKSERRDEIGV